jgi:DivIVA domain-containing protein
MMPLTPADIHNVAFKKPPIGKRGYDEEEVDAFLDGIEREIIRLIEENESLRRRVVQGPPSHEADGLSAAGYAELSELRSRLQRVISEKADTERVRDLLQADLERARAQAGARPLRRAGRPGGPRAGNGAADRGWPHRGRSTRGGPADRERPG